MFSRSQMQPIVMQNRNKPTGKLGGQRKRDVELQRMRDAEEQKKKITGSSKQTKLLTKEKAYTSPFDELI